MNPSDQYISADTVLSPERVEKLKGIVKGKEAELKKCRFGQAEKSLWLMGELEHGDVHVGTNSQIANALVGQPVRVFRDSTIRTRHRKLDCPTCSKPKCPCGFDAEGWRVVVTHEAMVGDVFAGDRYYTRRHKPECPANQKLPIQTLAPDQIKDTPEQASASNRAISKILFPSEEPAVPFSLEEEIESCDCYFHNNIPLPRIMSSALRKIQNHLNNP